MIKTLAAIVLVSIGAVLPAQSPLTVIKESNQKILDIYAAHKTIDRETEKKISRIINSVTYFEKISENTISKFCKELSAEECEEFNRVFQRLLRISSIRKLGRYRADRFDYLGKEVNGNKALVRTIVYFKNDKVNLDYHLESINGNWMIVNYVSDDVDTIRNYRKQFTRILKKEPFPKLIERLKKKIANMEQ